MTIRENPPDVLRPHLSAAAPLNLGPITRLLVQHEEDRRVGMILTTSDIRALVDEIQRLGHLLVHARQRAYLASLALLDHDLDRVRICLDSIACPAESGALEP